MGKVMATIMTIRRRCEGGEGTDIMHMTYASLTILQRTLGQSSLVLMTIMPVQNATNAGTSVTVLHAMVTSPPQITLNSGKSAVPMTSCVAPPPTLPHPPTRPLHRPTISLVNMRVVQHWHITKVDPARPMNRRMQILRY